MSFYMNVLSISFFLEKKQEGLFPLLPRVVDLVSDSGIPVIAAGGIVDGRGYVAALALGAQGVCLGTRYSLGHSCFHMGIYQSWAFTL
jgi:NAD(P)H-dependent flavin oxidoreductase YrpB (nitropropane dioxygenase family)